ncbi:hypothetical protein L3X38_015377 [Prunus dulcis]|uniref:Uncharacterized protein n=1 Tax=Prunus dulcis TaxID=3755 RepID=A0AAD4ZJC1_PRUDU|nr:hypothetical protein L3X38_015377 [Prunus dulcis]
MIFKPTIGVLSLAVAFGIVQSFMTTPHVSQVDYVSPGFCEDMRPQADCVSPEFCDDVTYMVLVLTEYYWN